MAKYSVGCLLVTVALLALLLFTDIRMQIAPAIGKSNRTIITTEPQTPEPMQSCAQSCLQPDLAFAEFDADAFFEQLVQTPLITEPKLRWVVEAGSYNGKQLGTPLARNFNVVVFEPSSRNFQRVTRRVGRLCRIQHTGCKGEFKIHQKAASGNRSTVEFRSSQKGGPGDHVVLNGRVVHGEYTEQYTKKEVVEAVPLDDYLLPIAEKNNIFVLKIDVQDHEPAVLRGLSTVLQRGLADFVLLEYRPQGWVHMFPDSKPEEELARVCGLPHFRCFYAGRMTRISNTNKRFPEFFPGWASVGPAGTGWTTADFNKKMMELKQPEEFGTWTDIVALNTNSTLAVAVFEDLLKRKCRRRMYNTSLPSRCRPRSRGMWVRSSRDGGVF